MVRPSLFRLHDACFCFFFSLFFFFFPWRLCHSCWRRPDALTPPAHSCILHASLCACQSTLSVSLSLHLNSSNNPHRAILRHFASTIRNAVFFAFRSWLAERHRLVIPSVGFLEHLQVLVTWARDLIKGSGPARTNSTIKWHGRGGQNNYVLSLSCFPVIQSSPRTFSSSSYYQCASHC